VTGAARLAALPETPTVIEAGLRGYEVTLWFGILAPARTPPAIVMRLNRDMVAALATTETKNALLAQGVEAAPGTPDAFTALIKSEVSKWRTVAKTAGIEGD
jgi:tripartite-type tricarboxylate transporter receptor subunit TctC